MHAAGGQHYMQARSTTLQGRTVGEEAGHLPLYSKLEGQLDVGGGVLVLPFEVLQAATGYDGRVSGW